MEIRGKSGLEAENQKVAGKFRRIQVVGLVCFLFVLVGIHFTIDGKFSVETLVAQATGNPLRSVLWLMLLFAIKSLTIVIPLLSLYVASGILFPPVWAVCVSFLGLAITMTLPYLLGRWSGAEELDYIKAKYPKIDKLVDIQKRNEFFASFIVRLIGWFPCDITSFYFGASRTSYPLYLFSGLLGSAVSVITNTLLGDVLMYPFSTAFFVLMVVKVLTSAGAIAIAYYFNRGK